MSRFDAIDRHSAEALRVGSGSFAAAARLFDGSTRRDARLLYAWCRHCDDVIDGQLLGHGRVDLLTTPVERIDAIERLTRAALAGEAMDDPAFAAFARVTRRRQIPARYPLDLVEGFRMDVDGRSYATLEDTLSYSYHVAGVVGLMMALVMGVHPDDADTLDRACDLGLAFQLTNIARDVIEDAERGRVYLPADWLAEVDVPSTSVAAPEHRAAVHAVAVRLLDVADAYYRSASAGLPTLPGRAAMAIGAARSVYRGIGRRLKSLGADAWTGRVSVRGARKLALVGSGAAKGLARRVLPVRPMSRDGLWIRPGREAV